MSCAAIAVLQLSLTLRGYADFEEYIHCKRDHNMLFNCSPVPFDWVYAQGRCSSVWPCSKLVHSEAQEREGLQGMAGKLQIAECSAVSETKFGSKRRHLS